MGNRKETLREAPDRQYLREKLEKGEAHYEDVSLKALVADEEHFQARVKADMGWCRELGEPLERGGDLTPVTAFDVKEKGLLYLADGFHRRLAYLNARRRSIPALVVEGTYQDAVRFAAMANTSERGLKRTREDIRKAVEMLFADEDCWLWGDPMIAAHCNTTSKSVRAWRLEHCSKTGKTIPERTLSSDGRMMLSNVEKNKPYPQPIGASGFRVPIDGERKCFSSKEEAESAFREAANESQAKLRVLNHPGGLIQFFQYRGLLFTSKDRSGAAMIGLFGLNGPSCVATSFSWTKSNSGTDTIPAAVGRVLMLREMAGDPTLRCIVLLYPESHLPKLMGLGQKLGVEFMTPEELVDDLTAKGFSVRGERRDGEA